MKRRLQLCLVFLICLFAGTSQANTGTYLNVATERSGGMPVWLIAPADAKQIVILFSGGGGNLHITQAGIKHQGNFLVRTRQMFADQQMIVAIPDKPADRADVFGYRTTAAHAQDIRALMGLLRQRFPGKPLWLVGTSRGTISVANVAARVQGASGPDGIVLTSSLTRGGVNNYDSLRDVDLSAIRVPVLIIHNRLDACRFTPFSDAEGLPAKLRNAPVKEFKAFTGGRSPGDDCQAKSYHGFLGIEKPVVDEIVKWIKSH